MKRLACFFLVIMVMLCGNVLAQVPFPNGVITADSTGDSPLTTVFTWQGHGNALVYPLAFAGARGTISGNFSVAEIPDGSTIIKAYYAITDWATSPDTIYASFAGVDLGDMTPSAYDFDQAGPFYLSLFRSDVTSLVSVNNVYSFSASGLDNSCLVYLVIVYENASDPEVIININDGAESLRNSSSITSFSGYGGGSGILKVVIEAADSGDPDIYGESIDDYLDKLDRERTAKRLVRRLRMLGFEVNLIEKNTAHASDENLRALPKQLLLPTAGSILFQSKDFLWWRWRLCRHRHHNILLWENEFGRDFASCENPGRGLGDGEHRAFKTL